jgi:hypothetical protein
MSKLLYACNRKHNFDERIQDKLLHICERLTPDNITKSGEHRIHVEEKTAYAVTLVNDALHEVGLSLLLGKLYESANTKWDLPGSDHPDGNYAIVRSSNNQIELLCDEAGSRTTWYYHDSNTFVASTSQRAIILFLGEFVFDERVIPWMLSTGTLGPHLSWDKRLRRLQPASTVVLDKNVWTLDLVENRIEFSEKKRSKTQHKELLTRAIGETIKHLEPLDFSRWVLLLSGGYDSRAILYFIKNQIGIPKYFRTITWGLRTSVTEEGNDAKIAKELAHAADVPNVYFCTDISSQPLQQVVDRFLLCGEGRVDHLAAYMDGMDIWRMLHEEQMTGIIRGDEGFGWKASSSAIAVRLSLGCALCADFENLQNLDEDFGIPPQHFPVSFEKMQSESLRTYCDRLYHAYRIPTMLAALSDIKFSYVEQINPLLSRSILNVVRSLPDTFRADKILFREIVKTIGPDLPFASKDAIADPKEVLRSMPFIELLRHEISSEDSRRQFGSRFVDFILGGIKDKVAVSNRTRPTRILEIVRVALPRFLKDWLRAKGLRPSVDGNTLAFRVYILVRMREILMQDAESGLAAACPGRINERRSTK